MNRSAVCPILLATLLMAASCRSEGSRNKETVEDTSVTKMADTREKPVPIFYEILMPMDMAGIFERAGSIYDKDLLNPVDKAGNYSASTKNALNLGVYGVDLGYIKLFGDPQSAIRYFGVIHKLATQLGIPEDFFGNAVQRFEQNAGNADSVGLVASSLYEQTDAFLKKADRAEASSLIILGSWVEGMYLASRIMEKEKSKELIMKRIASQKYALNNLITLLTNHGNDLTVSRYLVLLKQLRNSFDRIEIYYGQGKVDLDTVHKAILTEDYKVVADEAVIKEIISQITILRNEIVN